jgi:hypothetical protein
MALFNFFSTTSLLAREIKINESPASGEFYLYVEGDEIGLMNWILKKLGLKDPSVCLSVSDLYVTRINAKKNYHVTPTSQVHNFNSGFTKNKGLLILAFTFFLGAIVSIITIIGPIILGLLGLLCIWLYKKSGSMTVGLTTFNGAGNERMRIKSGLTGKQLEKKDFEELFNALKNAVSNNSNYFTKK